MRIKSNIGITLFLLYSMPTLANNLSYFKIPSSQAPLEQALWHISSTQLKPNYAVLFLHGATFPSRLASAFEIDNQSWMSILSDSGYQVYALDYLGYGASDRYPLMAHKDGQNLPPPGDAANLLADIKIAVDTSIKKSNVNHLTLIAHSRGGLLALMFAQQYPKLINKLILLSPLLPRAANSEKPLPLPTQAYQDINVDQRLENFSNSTPNKPNVLAKKVKQDWANAWLASDPTATKRNNRTVRVPLGYATDLANAWSNKIKLRASTIKTPILVMRGEWDPVPGKAEAETFIASLTVNINKRLITIPESTHVALLEKNRHLVYQYSLEFLKSNR